MRTVALRHRITPVLLLFENHTENLPASIKLVKYKNPLKLEIDLHCRALNCSDNLYGISFISE
jgi:hypothetical protein